MIHLKIFHKDHNFYHFFHIYLCTNNFYAICSKRMWWLCDTAFRQLDLWKCLVCSSCCADLQTQLKPLLTPHCARVIDPMAWFVWLLIFCFHGQNATLAKCTISEAKKRLGYLKMWHQLYKNTFRFFKNGT